MDNQHRQISGYRELTRAEVDLMNRVKAAGAALLEVQREVLQHLVDTRAAAVYRAEVAEMANPHGSEALAARGELARLNAAEPLNWAATGKMDVQRGVMALVRAVAQPTDG